MIRLPPVTTRTDPPFPYPTLCRSSLWTTPPTFPPGTAGAANGAARRRWRGSAAASRWRCRAEVWPRYPAPTPRSPPDVRVFARIGQVARFACVVGLLVVVAGSLTPAAAMPSLETSDKVQHFVHYAVLRCAAYWPGRPAARSP